MPDVCCFRGRVVLGQAWLTAVIDGHEVLGTPVEVSVPVVNSCELFIFILEARKLQYSPTFC